ncbi:hypothetical protein CDAR_176351, partial [Caerostris darwini]
AILLIAVRSGAVEACWAHKPEVYGSKPRSASKHSFISDHELYSPINVHVYKKKFDQPIREAQWKRAGPTTQWIEATLSGVHSSRVAQWKRVGRTTESNAIYRAEWRSGGVLGP